MKKSRISSYFTASPYGGSVTKMSVRNVELIGRSATDFASSSLRQ